MRNILVAGAGGFIGGHLVRKLLQDESVRVRAVDVKPLADWYQVFENAENLCLDLSEKQNCLTAVSGVGQVFNLAADMGGMGFIENNKALCMLSVLINTHLIEASREAGVERYFFASSACVYNIEKQSTFSTVRLAERDAYPAMPEDGYGWEKLFSERMCRHFTEDFNLPTRVARYHNVYGPFGTFMGGREKAPAAICRKVIEAKISGRKEIEIWGSGEQKRSFMFIDDCIRGTLSIMNSPDVETPINLGSEETVSINQLVDIVEEIAGVELVRKYLPDAPKGVNGRSSDNALLEETLGWQPSIPLRTGIEMTYKWIYEEMRAHPAAGVTQ